ncbi:MAG: tyrosinase family protein, partial [Cyclobacteriaceae bacterium]
MKHILLLVMIVLLSAHSSAGQQNEIFIRKNASSPEAKADLEAMEKAFEIMRNLPCTDGRSWYYQGAIHSVPDTVENNKLCPEYYKKKNDLMFGWANCTHGNNKGVKKCLSDSIFNNISSFNFIIWHRLYTYHLEEIIRELSGKKDFALPYWNYGGKKIDDNRLPCIFKDSTTSLYEVARVPRLRKGKTMDPFAVDYIRRGINETRNEPYFSNVGSDGKLSGLVSAIGWNPHGFIHNYVGGAYNCMDKEPDDYYNKVIQEKLEFGMMTYAATAGFDPVFWVHHSMVDRIWESWDVLRQADPKSQQYRPTLQDLKDNDWPYLFIDSKGNKIEYTPEMIMEKLYNLGYQYDELLYDVEYIDVDNGSVNTSLLAKKTGQEPTSSVVWSGKVDEKITSEYLRIPISKQNSKLITKSFNKSKKSLKGNKEADAGSMLLSIDVAVHGTPYNTYTVSLSYPGSKEDEYVGTMSFFGHGHHSSESGKHEMMNFTYYISDDLIKSKEPFNIIIDDDGGANNVIEIKKASIIYSE